MGISLEIYHGITLVATIFSVWGIVKATRAGRPKNDKDRVYHVKTFWVLFFGSALWLIAGLTPLLVDSTLVWTHFVFALGFGWSARDFHATYKLLPRK